MGPGTHLLSASQYEKVSAAYSTSQLLSEEAPPAGNPFAEEHRLVPPLPASPSIFRPLAPPAAAASSRSATLKAPTASRSLTVVAGAVSARQPPCGWCSIYQFSWWQDGVVQKQLVSMAPTASRSSKPLQDAAAGTGCLRAHSHLVLHFKKHAAADAAAAYQSAAGTDVERGEGEAEAGTGSSAFCTFEQRVSSRAAAAAFCSAVSTEVDSIRHGSPLALLLMMPFGFGES